MPDDDNFKEIVVEFSQEGSDHHAIYKIVRRDGQFCAVSEDGEHSFGCYPTEAEARERLRQVEAAKAAKNADAMTTGIADGHSHTVSPGSNRTSVVDGHSHPVITDDDGKVVSIGEANGHSHSVPDQMRLNKNYNLNLDDVEIFRTGTWNGDKYDARDLDDIVNAFDQVGFKPPVKLGHKEDSGDPAYGWVSSLRRVGDKLLASFVDLPKPIYEAIKNKRFNAVSSEIFFNLTRGNKKFRRVLKAVALLGAEIPAVSGLKPLHDSFRGLSVERESAYTLQMEDFVDKDDKSKKGGGSDDVESVEELTKQLKAANDQVAELKSQLEGKEDSALKVKALTETVEGLEKAIAESKENERRERIRNKVDKLRVPVLREHIAAMYEIATTSEKKVNFTVGEDKTEQVDPVKVVDDLVERINKHTEKIFNELSVAGDLKRDDAPVEDNDAGAELHKLTQEYMTKNKEKDYAAAFQAVLNDPENAVLKKKYAGVS